MIRRLSKPPEGARLKETPEMIAWRKEFSKLKTEDHLEKLASLGLDDEDLEEFKALEEGRISLEEEFGVDFSNNSNSKPKVKRFNNKK